MGFTTAGHPWDCVLREAVFLRRPLELLLENWIWRIWGGCPWKHVQVSSDAKIEIQKSDHFVFRYLWSNGPKECLEFPYYTFEEHYGKPIPSFPPRWWLCCSWFLLTVMFVCLCVINTIPVFCLFVLSFVSNISISSLFFLAREVLFDYLKGRWNKEDIQKYIKFSTVVRLLSKSSNNSMSLVCSGTLCITRPPTTSLSLWKIWRGTLWWMGRGRLRQFISSSFFFTIVCFITRFDYVIVASGHYSVPHVPTFPGVEKFPGRVLHAHDFR